VHGPDRGGRRGDPVGWPRQGRPHGGEPQRAAHDQEQEHGAQRMQADVDDVVPARIQSAGRVAECERQAGERTSRDGRVIGRPQHATEPREVADVGVLHDGTLIVEDERPRHAGGVDRHDQRDEPWDQPAPPRRAGLFGTGGRSGRPPRNRTSRHA
jgi:hypothetical protein